MTLVIPVLETARLILRGPSRDDFEDSVVLWSDPAVTRHIGGRPFDREEVWARLLRNVGHWAIAGYGMWHLFERASGRFVGVAGIADFERKLCVSFDGAPEAGWVLAPSWHGQGLATEAMTAVLSWAEAAGHLRTMCIIDFDNAPSLRVAARLGYREFARADYRGDDVIVLERKLDGSTG